jgi:acyl carrier protein
MASADPIVERLIALAAKRFGRAAGSLRPEDDLFEALGIHSLQALELLTELEDTFDIELPDYELQGVRTFRQLAACVERRL